MTEAGSNHATLGRLVVTGRSWLDQQNVASVFAVRGLVTGELFFEEDKCRGELIWKRGTSDLPFAVEGARDRGSVRLHLGAAHVVRMKTTSNSTAGSPLHDAPTDWRR